MPATLTYSQRLTRLRNAVEALVGRMHTLNSQMGQCICCDEELGYTDDDCMLEKLRVVLAQEDIDNMLRCVTCHMVVNVVDGDGQCVDCAKGGY